MPGRFPKIRRDERGFTLVEVLITIIVMGIVLGIATSSWFGVVRSRNVDSATNQVAADLRLAHSQATNRLADHTFRVTGADSQTYEVGPTSGTLATKTLPDGTSATAPVNITFKADGSATIVSGTTPITVKSSVDTGNDHTVAVTAATSRVQVVP